MVRPIMAEVTSEDVRSDDPDDGVIISVDRYGRGLVRNFDVPYDDYMAAAKGGCAAWHFHKAEGDLDVAASTFGVSPDEFAEVLATHGIPRDLQLPYSGDRWEILAVGHHEGQEVRMPPDGLQRQLPTGNFCIVRPADDPAMEGRHFVVIFPPEQGEITDEDREAMTTVALREAHSLARQLFGDPEHFTLSHNGNAIGSVPDIEHIHIYLFVNRQEKLQVFSQSVGKALETVEK